MAEKMKDSGIDWIGEVPESWEIKRVRHVIEQSPDGIRVGPFGSSLKEAVLNTDDGKYKIYGQANLIRHDFSFGENFVAEKDFIRLKNYEVKSGDVLLSMMGTIGKCSVVPDEIKPGIMDSHLIKIRLAKLVFGKYFEYVYEHSGVVYEQLIVNSNGSTMNGLNSSIVKNVYVPFPPIAEQRAIASFLDRRCAQIDGIIADLERQIDLLKRYKKSLITETVTKGLDKNAPMKDSGVEWIGEIPKGWEVKRVRNIIQQNPDGIRVGPFGSSLKEAVLNSETGDYKVYGQANLIRHDFSYGDNHISTKDFFRLKNYEVESGDVLLSMMGTIGKCSVVPEGIQQGIMDSHLIKIRLNQSVRSEYFEYVYEHSDVVYEQLLINSNGSTMNGLNSSIVKNVYVPLPSLEEQSTIVSFLDRYCAQTVDIIQRKQSQLDNMKNYKQSLIYEYVTGKKRVKEAQPCPSEQTN